ncbi:hypothetical protein Q8F57_003425 [Paraburkholderia terrae]|uniref:hypothetical protein n=1 Tax=Paraburkholderia terrae TaxID=311230 RepID=UPI00296B54BB|nr:hypothetical protein [Paraburkholderia terrae]MDW3655423.1 hypothetical protein [Paraburkholderia terrae]
MTEQIQQSFELQKRLTEMLARPGVYIAGDANAKDVTTVLVVRDGKVFSTKLDEQLDPERFLETLTLAGPYKASGREAIQLAGIRAAFPEGPARAAAMEMYEQLEELRILIASYYIKYLRWSFLEQVADRNPNGGVVAFLQWAATHASNAHQLNMAVDGFMKDVTDKKPSGATQ